MFGKHRKTYYALAASILIGAVCSPGMASADRRSEGFAIQDDYEWQKYQETFSGFKDTSGARKSSLKANASKEEIQDYIKNTLNSNEGVGDDIKIRGRMKTEDGKYRVAITYYGTDNEQKDVVVEMDSDGTVLDFDPSMSDQELQAAYDEIVYGGQNELSIFDVITVNDVIHAKSDQYMKNVSRELGIDTNTASKAAASAVSLAGVVIMGAGASGKQKHELLSNAYSRAVTKRFASSVTSTPKGETSSLVDKAFEKVDGRVSPYGSVGCAETVACTGAYYNADLKEEYLNGTASVPTLVSNLVAKGYECSSYEGHAEKGDLLIYGDDDHVVIADGQGGCFGNSSSAGHAKYYSDAAYAWNDGELPSKIIKMR